MSRNFDIFDEDEELQYQLESMEEIYPDADDDVRYRWACEETDFLLDDVISMLDRAAEKQGSEGVIVHGTSKRWDGTSTGYDDPAESFASICYHRQPYVCDPLKDCHIYGIGTDKEADAIVVCGVHHDGFVSIECRCLTDDGWDYLHGRDDYGLEWEDLDAVYHDSKLTFCPDVSDVPYGDPEELEKVC